MDVLALSNLLQDFADDNLDNKKQETVPASSSILTPASFGSTTERKEGGRAESIQDSDDIWSAEEVSALPTISDEPDDNRTEPSYQLYFKQEIGTEDIFLGTDKSPGSFDCSHVVVKVYFPNATLDELNLDVRSNSMLVESRDKKLTLTLPLDVEEEDGNAQWDAAKSILSVTLPVKAQF